MNTRETLNAHFEDTFPLFLDNVYGAYMADESKTAVSIRDVKEWVKNGSTGSPAFNYIFVPLPS